MSSINRGMSTKFEQISRRDKRIQFQLLLHQGTLMTPLALMDLQVKGPANTSHSRGIASH